MATYIKSEGEKDLEGLTANSLEALGSPETQYQVNEDGSLTIDFVEVSEEDMAYQSLDEGHYANLVDLLDEDTKRELGQKIIANVAEDDGSRSEWLTTIKLGFDLLGLTIEEKNEPFRGACSAQHPLLMESAVKFQSKASNELLPPNGPVKTRVMGDKTLEREEQANRVKEHLNYQLTELMTEFYPDTERLLLYVPLVGSGFKKPYYNYNLERPCSEFVPAHQFIVPNSAPDLTRAPRYTHVLYKSVDDMEADYAIGLYKKPSEGLGEPQSPKMHEIDSAASKLIGIEIGVGDNGNCYTLFEQYLNLYLEPLEKVDPNENAKGFKVASPYVVTVDANSGEILSIRRNWREGDSKRKKKIGFAHYGFVPSFGFYNYGYLHLLGNLQLSLTAALRSLVDAGQFANLQGGFKLKGVRIVNSDEPIFPGQFKELETHVQDINKAIMPLPFKEPSNVLFQMLSFLDAKGQKFADSTEQVIADSVNYGPVGTTMALLEASTKFFSAVHKRLHAALKSELRIIAEINSETLKDDDVYNIENSSMKITRADYSDTVDVIPVSDPNSSSSAHRMTKAQTLWQFAMQAPDLHDRREVLKRVYTNLDYGDIDKLLPPPEEAQPNDPLTDIQRLSQGKAIKAFPGQDHQAHIALKQSFLQNPATGQNPLMQQVAVGLQANIQEHLIMQFTEQVQVMSQQSGEQVTPEQAMAQAAQQIAQMNMKKLEQEVQAATRDEEKDKAAEMLAKAELLDTQTQARKQAWIEKRDAVDLTLKKEALNIQKANAINKAKEIDKKHAHEIQKLVTAKGLDSIMQSIQPSPKKEKLDKSEK